MQPLGVPCIRAVTSAVCPVFSVEWEVQDGDQGVEQAGPKSVFGSEGTLRVRGRIQSRTW